jgi:hypothetical protein
MVNDKNVMKLFIVVFVFALLAVGYIEDPCTTEGLAIGCMTN